MRSGFSRAVSGFFSSLRLLDTAVLIPSLFIGRNVWRCSCFSNTVHLVLSTLLPSAGERESERQTDRKRQRETETETQRDEQTDRKRETETQRETEIQTETET